MLYRRYRPKTFSEVVGQDDVIRTLRGALATDRPGHAYLFSGPRGTGKTTMARIMAKAVNCAKRTKEQDPCNICDSCASINSGGSMDFIEIDAASNRGIDDIRALKESAGTAPTAGIYKVFIIDEVHALTKDAFNALLKVLEEPPPHVMFLLATTEAHKILPTVMSRVQRLNVLRLHPEQIVEKLNIISKKEKVKVSTDVLMAIAKSADGALRDAEVMLSKVLTDSIDGEVDSEGVYTLLGLVPATWHISLADKIMSYDRSGAIAQLKTAESSGADADNYAKGFLEYLRGILMAKVNNEQEAKDVDGKYLVKTIQAFTHARQQIRSSPIPYLPLELAVIELTEKTPDLII